MKAIARIFAAVVTGLSASIAFADNNIQYNYLEFRFVLDSEVDDSSIDGDGFAFGGSIRMDEVFYLIADYESLEYDFGIDSTVLQFGAGAILPVNKIDLFGELTLAHGDADSGVDNVDDTGYRLSAGVRGYAIPQLELRAFANHIDLEEDDSYVTIAGDYFLNESFSVNFSQDISADIERTSIGLRYYLGK